MSSAKTAWAGVLAAVVAVGLAAVPVYLSSCTPGEGITAAESDVVVSLFDPEVDFGSLKTYALVDSIYHVCDTTGTDCPDIGRGLDAQILARIDENFQARDYTPVGDPTTTTPDFVAYASVTQSDFYTLAGSGCGWYYPPGWGWYWPGWCWGYPPSMRPVYAYSTGTLTISMLTSAAVDSTDMEIPVAWTGTLNGVLNDTSASTQQRVIQGIDQAFTQSPYLRSNQ